MSDYLIKDIIEYFREAANRHSLIKCYRTGESYENNESGFTYPLLFLNTDFIFSYNYEQGIVSHDTINVSFKISVLTKTREAISTKPVNQIKMIDTLTPQDDDISLTFNILQHILNKFIDDCNDYTFKAVIMNTNGLTSKRVWNDDCDGWQCDILLRMDNPYQCIYMDYFGDDILDEGQNKTPSN